MLFNPYYLLFLPANSGDSILPGLPASVNRKLNGGNQPFTREVTCPGARCGTLANLQNPRKVPLMTGVWEFCTRPGPGATFHSRNHQ